MSEFWSNLTDESEALDAILTGYKGEVKNMPIYEDVTKYLVGNHDKSVLDFGCGAGRNIQWLKHNYKTVYGYDFPNMLKLAARETLEDENVYLSSNLDDICSRDYDIVLFSITLFSNDNYMNYLLLNKCIYQPGYLEKYTAHLANTLRNARVVSSPPRMNSLTLTHNSRINTNLDKDPYTNYIIEPATV